MRKLFHEWQDSTSGLPTLILLSAFFLCGAVVGCIVAGTIEGSAGESLVETLTGTMRQLSVDSMSSPLWWEAFWHVIQFPLLIFALSFCIPGVLAIPLAVSLRAFILSYSITAFVRLFGFYGWKLALALFGIQCLISVPMLLWYSVSALGVSTRLTTLALGRVSIPVVQPGYFVRTGICATAMAVCALLETALTPWILGLVLH